MSCFENNLSLKEMLKAILLSSDPDIKTFITHTAACALIARDQQLSSGRQLK